MNIQTFEEKKRSGTPITMVTCYDYTMARIVNDSEVDCILVGDSLGMVMLGLPNTLNVSTQVMALHTTSVVRGAPKKFIVGDLPFMSYRKGLTANMTAIEKIMKAGAHAVKLEGAHGNLKLIEHSVQSGAPVMGHLGLTPQSINQLGGFKVQGREHKAKEMIKQQARDLQNAGCFSVVLECVPTDLAKEISEELMIPTIGIGAGPHTNGQVLVLQDMLGMNNQFKPKFLKQYLNGFEVLKTALNEYHSEVCTRTFPSKEHTYL